MNSPRTNRLFQVYTRDTRSTARKLKKSIPQRSIIAPLFFNINTTNLPETKLKKQEMGDKTLNEPLGVFCAYFRRWQLSPNTSKTEACPFHFSNRLGNNTFNITFNGKVMRYKKNPKYLGVTFDKTLTFKGQLTKVAGKVRA